MLRRTDRDAPFRPAPGQSLHPWIRDEIRWKTEGRCFYCGRDLPDEGRTFAADHICAGIDDMDNLVLACRSCNARKCKATLTEFRERLRRAWRDVPDFSPEQRAYLARLGCFPPRVTTFRFWFETAAGRAVLDRAFVKDRAALARLSVFVVAAGGARLL
jgi:hypothetical protein